MLIFCRCQNFLHFQYGGPVQKAGAVRERVRPWKQGSWRQCPSWRLHAKRATPSWRRRRSSAGPGRSQQLLTLPSQTGRGFFCVCANFLSAPAFCRRQDFVDAEILSMPVFVDANILSTPIFFWLQYLCLGVYFVSANILSSRIFCRRQHFYAANIFWFCLG